MKKSVWLIIGMCIILLSSFVNADIYFNETFNRASCSGDCWGTPTSDGTDYVYVNSGSATFTIASNSFGHIIDTAIGGDPMAYTNTSLNDNINLWVLNMDWKYTATTNCRFLMRSSDELNSVYFFIQNGQYAFYNGTSYNYFGIPIINVWHNIKIEVNEFSSVCSVYVDNVFIAFYNIKKNLNISKIGFGANGGGEVCSSYFDNVTITSELGTNFSISASDYFSSENIYNFSALINGSTYYSNVTSGVLITGINKSLGLNFSMNISSSNYFNRSYYVNISNMLSAKLYQSIINISGINTLHNSINNWTLYNDSKIILNTSTNSGIVYLSEGTYNNLHIISNDNNFVNQDIDSFTITALDNKSVNISIYDFSLNITAKNLITSNFIDNFSISIKNLADSSTTRNFNTTTGNVLIGIMNSSYNITLRADGYSFYNSSVILELNSSYNYTFNLYTRNSVNISIYDEDTGVLVNELMDVSFVSSSLSYNFSTTTGTLYEDLLSPNSYAITYEGDNYSLRTYYFELVNNSYNRLVLYTSKLVSSNVTAIVYDKSSVTLEGARIKVKKYSNIYNSFIATQIAQTNFEGSAGLDLKLLNTFYIFEIYYPADILRFESDKTYIYDTTIRFYIDIQDSVARDYYNIANIYGSLNYESNRFKMVYDNPAGTSYEFCLNVYKSRTMGDLLLNSTCVTSSGGTIYSGFTPVNGSTYYGKSTVDYDGENVVLDVLSKSFKTSLTNKNYWLFIVLLMCIVFAFVDYQMSSKMVILTPVPLVFASYLGIINISLYITIGIWVASFVLSLILKGR